MKVKKSNHRLVTIMQMCGMTEEQIARLYECYTQHYRYEEYRGHKELGEEFLGQMKYLMDFMKIEGYEREESLEAISYIMPYMDESIGLKEVEIKTAIADLHGIQDQLLLEHQEAFHLSAADLYARCQALKVKEEEGETVNYEAVLTPSQLLFLGETGLNSSAAEMRKNYPLTYETRRRIIQIHHLKRELRKRKQEKNYQKI